MKDMCYDSDMTTELLTYEILEARLRVKVAAFNKNMSRTKSLLKCNFGCSGSWYQISFDLDDGDYIHHGRVFSKRSMVPLLDGFNEFAYFAIVEHMMDDTLYMTAETDPVIQRSR